VGSRGLGWVRELECILGTRLRSCRAHGSAIPVSLNLERLRYGAHLTIATISCYERRCTEEGVVRIGGVDVLDLVPV